MNWKKALGYGVGIYVAIFIFWSLIVAFEQGEAAWGWYASFVVILLAAHHAGSKLGTKDCREILKYSASWVVVVAALDAIITTRFTGYEFYNSWEVYVAYGLILLAPMSVRCCKGKCCASKCNEEAASPEQENNYNQGQM